MVCVLSGLVALASFLLTSTSAATTASDPCAKIANQTFSVPADALACLKSFPFNETLRQNVLTVVSRVFDFYTFEDFYLNSPPPFQESTTNIRADLSRINSTKYEVSCETSTSPIKRALTKSYRPITTSTRIYTTLPHN